MRDVRRFECSEFPSLCKRFSEVYAILVALADTGATSSIPVTFETCTVLPVTRIIHDYDLRLTQQWKRLVIFWSHCNCSIAYYIKVVIRLVFVRRRSTAAFAISFSGSSSYADSYAVSASFHRPSFSRASARLFHAVT